MAIAGLAATGRSCAALVRAGLPVELAAEESFSRRRHDPSLPTQALQWCSDRAGVPIASLQYVAFAERPVQRFIRLLGAIATGFPWTLRIFPETMTQWLGDRLWVHSGLVRRLGLAPSQILFLDRNLSLASSAFFPAGLEDAVVVIVDGVGEWASTAVYRGQSLPDRAGSLEAVCEIPQPHSLVHFLDAILHHLQIPEIGGLRWLGALAALGSPSLLDAMQSVVKAEKDGAFSLSDAAIDFTSKGPRFKPRAWKFLGAPRDPNDSLTTANTGNPAVQRFADVARSAQDLCAQRCLELLRAAAARVHSPNLCIGGRLLQLPAIVDTIVEHAAFENIRVDPLQDEAAAALGAALYVARVAVDPPWPGVGWEPREEALSTPERAEGLATQTHAPAALATRAASRLARGEVIGWVQGRPEPSGREQGLRVLLVNPLHAVAFELARLRIKQSEPFLPWGALCLAEVASRWIPTGERYAPRRQGLAPTRVPEADRSRVGSALHKDGTILLYVVDPGRQPLLARVLECFAQLTGGWPLLAQSSFNRSEEPPPLLFEDCADLLRRSELSALFFGCAEVTVSGR